MGASETRGVSIVFTPTRATRILFWLILALCVPAMLGEMFIIPIVSYKRLGLLLALQFIACLLALRAIRTRYEITETGVLVNLLFGRRCIEWNSLLYLDQMRHSFVVIGKTGKLAPDLIRPNDADRMMRLILQHGRLRVASERVPWYVIARFRPIETESRSESL